MGMSYKSPLENDYWIFSCTHMTAIVATRIKSEGGLIMPCSRCFVDMVENGDKVPVFRTTHIDFKRWVNAMAFICEGSPLEAAYRSCKF